MSFVASRELIKDMSPLLHQIPPPAHTAEYFSAAVRAGEDMDLCLFSISFCAFNRWEIQMRILEYAHIPESYAFQSVRLPHLISLLF
ncbi:hypothetical protein ORG37_00665 [Rahnella perminowiae]|uniref:hypothetical protein n=1 Tax=Rahnella perminowiae TaxID=2816244 RepID=UPI00224B984A|nr:hypothetical protein [Rahnella perminowiae]MCX2941620.1 hypothetical protein [Rahnella perminowiae]